MWNKNKKVNFDLFVNNYNKLLKKKTSFFSSHEYFSDYKVRLAIENLNISSLKKIRILEYGCGIGRNIKYLKKYFKNFSIELSACDVSIKSLNFLKRLFPSVKCFDCSGRDYIYNHLEKYDIIFIAGVFHHISPKERHNVSRNISSMLKNDGQLIIFEHNPFNPITRKIVKECEYDEDAILLTPKKLISYFSKIKKMKLKEKKYYLFIPQKFRFLNFIEKYLSWFPMGGQYFLVFNKK